MAVIGVTGPRKLTAAETVTARQQLMELLADATHLHVGDAAGLDTLAVAVAEHLGLPCTVHHAQGRQPWQLAKRSKQMVDAVAAAEGTLASWPNKPCPEGLTASSWKGSGTWGTTRYAVIKGVAVELRPLVGVDWPLWLSREPEQQLSLC
ncbi:hypothetical protein [Leptothoe sp. PORK10 BA2]|uniref:hypothetical protein n=1 Tax=Leptothoe sp. PORK10 BA2 TaxID=3110254 RepID=UPI002B200E32|nr:hypothetical protein [Leptothoe sp. PORK10 BA2]MEA5465290.1 hypothetical protein [Leptothoe sp. PORK10 BA2]